uniref:Uncharacterized protein n=1 Tax=Anopheles farauti TaxID=69004 RepID=A0A182QFU1_9DIPT
MPPFGPECIQMERTGHQYGRVTYCPYSDSSSSELQSYVRPFDTVRALHETVVSLRTALEESRREVDQLRQQINVRDTVEQGRVGSIASKGSELSTNDPRKQGESTSTPGILKYPSKCGASRESLEETSEDKKPRRPTTKKRKPKVVQPQPDESCSSPLTVEEEPPKQPPTETPLRQHPKKVATKDGSTTTHQKVSVVPDIQIVSHPGASAHSAMASRIDVKIKVSSNINMDGSSSEAESSECPKDSPTTPEATGDPADQTPDDDEKTIGEQEDRIGPDDDVTVREQVPKTDGTGEKLCVSVVNEEQLSVSKSSEAISIRQVSSENLHVDTDRQSNASISEGDNSVFAEDPAAGTQPEPELHGTGPITGSYTLTDVGTAGDPRRRIKKSESENQEEVDDIELIFSSDDTAKDITQEDLVSISDYEPWHEAGQSGTPVLVSFTNLPSFERTDSEVTEGYELEKGKSLESQDSLSLDNMKKSLDLSTKSSSLEKESSMDTAGGVPPEGSGRQASDRDEDERKQDDRFDVSGPNALAAAGALGRRWTNYNVLIETDISKCGIAEENILEMGRRNTCPNPPAYRPIIHPGSRMQPAPGGANRSPLAVKFSRSPRTYSPHQYLPPGKTLRTVIAAESGVRGATGDEVKRSRAAQTDISALAQQWRSETHLAGSEYVPGLYTLPSKFVPPPPGGKGKFPLSSDQIL